MPTDKEPTGTDEEPSIEGDPRREVLTEGHNKLREAQNRTEQSSINWEGNSLLTFCLKALSPRNKNPITDRIIKTTHENLVQFQKIPYSGPQRPIDQAVEEVKDQLWQLLQAE